MLLGLGIAPVLAAPLAYITNSGDRNVSVIDTATHAVIATVPVVDPFSLCCLGPVAVHPAGTRVYVTYWGSRGGTVAVIDTTTHTITDRVSLGGVHSFPGPGVAVNPAGTRIYATVSNPESFDRVTVIDTATNTPIGSVSVRGGLGGVAVNPTGTRAYVANGGSSTVSVVHIVADILFVLATVPVGRTPQGIAVHPGGIFLYVTNSGDNSVSVIDTTTHTTVATVGVGVSPSGVAVHPAGTRVYIANSGSNTVSVVHTATHTVVATVPVGTGPSGLAVHPAGTRAYVANSGSNSVSVIDTTSNTVSDTVTVGSRPLAFGQFIGPELAGVSLTLNQATFRRGETLTLGATTYAGDTPHPVDAYVAVQLPDGTLFFLQGDGSLTTAIQPIVRNWTVSSFTDMLFRYTFGGGEPSGNYRWLAAFTEPGTLNILGLIAQAAFTFSP